VKAGVRFALRAHILPAGATGFPSRSACVAARSEREVGGGRSLERGSGRRRGELMRRALAGLMQQRSGIIVGVVCC